LYKFRLRCCVSSKEVSPALSSSATLREDAAEPEHLHWSAFGPPSDDFKVLKSFALYVSDLDPPFLSAGAVSIIPTLFCVEFMLPILMRFLGTS
jgi:hypothetical protein